MKAVAACTPGLEEVVCAVAGALESLDMESRSVSVECRMCSWGIELNVRVLVGGDGDGDGE